MKVSPRDYARNNREWRGKVPLSTFERLASDIQSESESVEVQLAFSLNENEHVRIQGHATIDAAIACHRCMESIATTVRADIDALIVRSDRLAQKLAHDVDVIVVEDNPVEIASLLEDDLLMSIPWRVCASENDCPNLESKVLDEKPDTGDTQRPFANLRSLLEH